MDLCGPFSGGNQKFSASVLVFSRLSKNLFWVVLFICSDSLSYLVSSNIWLGTSEQKILKKWITENGELAIVDIPDPIFTFYEVRASTKMIKNVWTVTKNVTIRSPPKYMRPPWIWMWVEFCMDGWDTSTVFMDVNGLYKPTKVTGGLLKYQFSSMWDSDFPWNKPSIHLL